MNLLDNPSFQEAQRGPSFNLAQAGVYTLDLWVSVSAVDSLCNIKRVSNPLGCEVEFNAAGVGGIMQFVEHEQIAAHIGKPRKLSVNVAKMVSGSIPMKLMVLGWGGAANKPTMKPITNFSTFALGSNWSVIAADDYTVTTTDARFELDIPNLPGAQNIAVLALFDGAGGDYVVLRDVSLSKTADFEEIDWTENVRRCAWFYQHYPYETIMNAEWGVGRKDPGGFVSFQFPLSYPLRGALGGNGVYDIDVDWPVSVNGFWHYGGGAWSMFPGSPVMTCHHRHFILFTSPAVAIGQAQPTIWRHWWAQPGATVSISAELRP